MGKIIVTIILANIEITIIQTIIFEFENVLYLSGHVSPDNSFVIEKFCLKKEKRPNLKR